jgi:hypothetical protein
MHHACSKQEILNELTPKKNNPVYFKSNSTEIAGNTTSAIDVETDKRRQRKARDPKRWPTEDISENTLSSKLEPFQTEPEDLSSKNKECKFDASNSYSPIHSSEIL